MFQLRTFSEDCALIRRQSPVIHNITNYVAMGISANALLAIGASPIMSSEPDEMVEIVSASDALVINIGCLEKPQVEAMRIAAGAAMTQGKPWVLDPVGVGASSLRRRTCEKLISNYFPTVIRGNASEIMVLAGAEAISRGVDAAEESSLATESAVKLARETGAVVSVSGPVDYITDGNTMVSISNGSPLMPRVTALGCTASAITAAFLAVDRDALQATCGAMALMGTAGETAAACSKGPGSLAVNFIDTLAGCNPAAAAELLRYEEKPA